MVCWSSWALPDPVNYVLGSNNQTVRLLVRRNVINEVRVAVLHQALQGNDNSFLSHTLEQNVGVILEAALRVGCFDQAAARSLEARDLGRGQCLGAATCLALRAHVGATADVTIDSASLNLLLSTPAARCIDD